MGRTRPVPRRLGIAAVAVLCLTAWGCTGSVEPPGRLGDPAAIAGEGVCGLLAEEELELALNAPLRAGSGQASPGFSPSADGPAVGQSPQQSAASGEGVAPSPDAVEAPGGGRAGDAPAGGGGPRPVVAGMDMCARDGQDGARAAWGVLTEADQSDEQEKAQGQDEAGGRQDEDEGDTGSGQPASQTQDRQDEEADRSAGALFQRYVDWHGDYLHRVDVDGHAAVWDPRLRTLLVRAGERLVGVSLTVPNPPVGETDEDDDGDADGDQDAAGEGDDHESGDEEKDDNGAQGDTSDQAGDDTRDDAGESEADEDAEEDLDVEVEVTPEVDAYLQQRARDLAARILGRL